MGIQAKQNEIELIITWVCNWHCEYCCVDTHMRPKLPFEDVKQKLEQVPAGYNVTISGGEPGTMKRHELEYIFDKLEEKQCTISINTNGTFIKKYRDLCSRVDQILYHCTQDIDDSEKLIKDDGLSIDYLVIVTDNNFDNLQSYLDSHPDIQFNLVAASNPDNINNPTLSSANKHKMLRLYHDRMTEQSIRRVFTEKDFDAITYL